MTPPNSPPPYIKVELDEDGLDATFEEYKFIVEDTAKQTDRRQTVSNLFVTINVLFITGGGYLLTQFTIANQGLTLFWYSGGLLAIAIVTSLLNRFWLQMAEHSRRLLNLRFRYLEALEAMMRRPANTFFSDVKITLRADEHAPANFVGKVIPKEATADQKADLALIRGTYSLEEVLYGDSKNPSFSDIEKHVTATFISVYWVALAVGLSAATVINWEAILQLLGR